MIAVVGVPMAWAVARNSVGSAQIKNGAVDTQDLADNAVTSPKVANGSLLGEDFAAGQLPAGPQGPDGPRGPDGVTGPAGAPDTPQQVLDKIKQVDGSGSGLAAETAATAANATHADAATNATNAAHATNSDQLGGLAASGYYRSANVKRIDFTLSPVVNTLNITTILTLGELTVKAFCTKSPTPGLSGTSLQYRSTVPATVNESSIIGPGQTSTIYGNWSTPIPANTDTDGGGILLSTAQQGGLTQGTFVYRNVSRTITATITLMGSDTSPNCTIWGVATSSP